MAEAKSPIRTSRDSLHEQEPKRITDPIPAATKRTILGSQETDKWLQSPRQWNVVSLIWKSEMYCIFDIAEHHPITALIAMVAEINSPLLIALNARMNSMSSNAMTESSLSVKTLTPVLLSHL